MKAIATAAPAASRASAKEEILWDRWYGITLQPKTPFGYYNERVSKKDGKIFLQTDLWKKEEGYLNEEHYGGVSLDDAVLTPSFYNIRKNYRAIEITIDGSLASDGAFLVKAREGRNEPSSIKKFLPPKAFLSSFFPVWLGRNLSKLEGTQTVSFQGVLEDKTEEGSSAAYGTVRKDAPDEFAKKTGTTRVLVRFNEQSSVWWVKENGEAARMHLEETHAIVEEMPKERAKAFLGSGK